MFPVLFPIRGIFLDKFGAADDQQVFGVPLFRVLGEVEAARYHRCGIYDHDLIVGYRMP
jgi:hypothetical protein